MYLKSLTIKGFKSFAQSTTFQFEPGITAIVGPNGSGKSNVVDALAWVMGEQGAKTLRGGKMEDVIFAGTRTRGPLGRAEVTVTIDNSDGALPIEYAEVTIRRTLFRHGSSEYAINGESCRLRDVQDLLSDSGLGREMHVIVGQGQLDAVLRATPEERRGFIEEAAGILKHRRRKERTVRKLDAMEVNLTRLNDLSVELRKQLKPLGQQAETARSAQRIAAVVRDAEARICADDFIQLQGRVAALTAETELNEGLRAEAQRQAAQHEAVVNTLEQGAHDEARESARRIVAGHERSRASLMGVAAQAQQRAQFLRGQVDDTPELPVLSDDEVRAATAEHAECAAMVVVAQAEADRATHDLGIAEHALTAHDTAAAQLVAEHNAHEMTVQQLNSELVAAERTRALRVETQQRYQADLHDAQLRRDEAKQHRDAFERASASEQAASGRVGDSEYELARQTQVAAETVARDARERVYALQQQASALEARIGALGLAKQQRDGSAAVLAAGDAEVLGVVSAHVRVAAGFEVAVAAALGVAADAVLVSTVAAGVRAVQHAAEGDHGRVMVLWNDAPGEPGPKDARDRGWQVDPRFTQALSGLAEVTRFDEVVTAGQGVRGLLANSCVVPDDAAAIVVSEALRAAVPGLWWSVVTRTGEVYSPFSLLGGSAQAPSSIELQAESEVAQQRATEVAVELVGAREALGAAEGASASAVQRTGEMFAAMRVADAQRAERDAEYQSLVVRLESAQRDVERFERVLGEARVAVSAAEAVVRECERVREPVLAVTCVLPDAGSRAELLRVWESARAVELATRVTCEKLVERERSLQVRMTQLAERVAAEQRAAERAADRARVRQQQLDLAVAVGGAVAPVLQACEQSLGEARELLRGAEFAQREAQRELQRARSGVDGARVRVAQLTEVLHGLQLRGHEVNLQLSGVRERAASLGFSEDVLCAEYGPQALVPADELPGSPPMSGVAGEESLAVALARELGVVSDESSTGREGELGAADVLVEGSGVPYVRAEQVQRLAAAQRRLAKLGRFNPLALEEFSALEQRHRYLAEQLTDLQRTRQDLLRIMVDLDEKMERIFADAFADTQVAFARVFPILFPGGSGEISLSDAAQMLTTGIEMTVRPAGKNVARMSLLSGGERSLAAIAWLLAIFHARPSPFYLMDEVEAALDDANLGRLLQSFTELSESSQLIVITHQKRTMEIADALYGVSMKQDGVSLVVGQKLAPQ